MKYKFFSVVDMFDTDLYSAAKIFNAYLLNKENKILFKNRCLDCSFQEISFIAVDIRRVILQREEKDH